MATLLPPHDLRPPPDGWPDGAPANDHLRSPAAAQVARLAAREGLFCFHFEHRAALPLPDAWITPGREDDAAPPTWEAGVLPEGKYQSYRHDLLLGSFHPGHRAKWSAHELAHGMVGFAWAPQMSALAVATAARLAELVPVALWYFWDEIHAARCSDHLDAPATASAWCGACERVQGIQASDPDALRRRDAGWRFVDAELAAIARTRRLGRPIPHAEGGIDLCTDGLAYARAHGPRLRSDAFARFCAGLAAGPERARTLDALEARALAVARAITDDAPLPPLAPSPAVGRARWILQDVGWRLLQVWEDADGEARDALDAAIAGLEAAVDAGVDDAAPAVAAAQAAFAVAWDEWYLPDPEPVFAVGYALPTGGHAVEQLVDGLRTVVPLTLELIDDAEAGSIVLDFAAADPVRRAPIGARFADWLADRHPGPVAELAAYEAAISAARRDGLAETLGDGDGAVLAEGAVVACFSLDPVALAAAVEAGTAEGAWVGGRLTVLDHGRALPDAPCALVVGQGPDGAVLADLPRASGDALRAGLPLPPAETDALRALGLLVPTRWPC